MMRSGKQRHLILNDDGARPYFLEENLEAPEPFSPEQFARAAVEPYVGRGIDTLFWCVGGGNVFTTRMQSAEIYGWDTERDLDEILTELPEVGRPWARGYIRQCRRLWAEGTDDLDLVVREGHRHSLEIFASVRMNDLHYRADHSAIERCKFQAEHPEYNLAGPLSALDYGRPEVREWRLGHLEELARNWDIDGLELDFIRFPIYFHEPAAEKAALMTDFIGRLRAVLDDVGAQRGRPVLLAIRPLETLELSLGIGLDVRTWLERDWIDLICLGGYTVMDPPLQDMIALAHAHGCQVYPAMCYPRSDPYLLGWAANAQAIGGDGLYLFNIIAPERSRLVYNQLADPAQWAGQSKVFDAQHRFLNCPWHSDPMLWRPSLPLPKDLSAGSTTVPIRLHDALQAASGGRPPVASLRLTITGLLGDAVQVSLNGHRLTEGTVPKDTPTQRHLAEWQVPVERKVDFHISKLLAPTHEYPVPIEWLTQGYNETQVIIPFAEANWERTYFDRCPLAVTLAAANLLLDYSA